MKNYTLLVSIFTLIFIQSQNAPIDFEPTGNGDDWTWTVFENNTNPPLEIVSNPDMTGINTSDHVAKFTALQSGQPYAGCESLHGSDIGTFTIDATNSIIRIMVWKTTISDVGIKLVRNDNWSLGEIKIANTLTNQWEQLEFDFSAHIGNTYDQIVIFPDFTNRTSDNIIYFDNVYGNVLGTEDVQQQDEIQVVISPNPVQNVLFIQTEETIEKIEIFNSNGQLVSTKNQVENNTIELSSLTSGVYHLNVYTEKGIATTQFIKK